MRTIWKYPVPLGDPFFGVKGDFSIELPAGAAILCVQVQGVGGAPHIWAECDSDRPKVTRKFRLIGTGHPIEDPVSALRYIGTFQLDNGHFVGHLYERIEG